MSSGDFVESDFSYSERRGSGAAHVVTVSIYANRLHLRAALRDDAVATGARVLAAGPLRDLLDEPSRPIGDVVLLDCPQINARTIAALSELDQHAARSGTRLIVSTTLDALDPVFACMDQSAPTLLVDPGRTDRILALGQVIAELPSARLRELSEADRLMLLRLNERVSQIAGRLENMASESGGCEEAVSAFSFRSGVASGGARGDLSGGREARLRLPDPRLVRGIIRQRQLRARFFDGGLFSDPAWEMLLDLTAARGEGTRVSVTSLCIASGAPPTTALRWIGQMVEAGLFLRVCDDSDRRRAFIELTDRSVDAMARYFSEIALTAPVPV